MEYKNADIARVAELLKKRIAEVDDKPSVLKSVELKALYDQLRTVEPELRAEFGKEVNSLKLELQAIVDAENSKDEEVEPLDITAPFDANVPLDRKPKFLPTEQGSQHVLMKELKAMLDICYRMGFTVEESRQLDDDFHMFESLNFPEGHPARDDYDSFVTDEGLIAPAHTSTMQNRVLKKYKSNLENGEPIAAVVPGRVFRNEDVDARHEHTFYQLEGVYVDKGINVGNLIATLKAFMNEYYGKELPAKIQPFYFPFTEPSFEFALGCPFCDMKGCNVCSRSGWLELLGCGMIHPNVLRMANIDPEVYTGFAWGIGFMRMVMIKYGIEDIRHFESGKLEFLRQF